MGKCLSKICIKKPSSESLLEESTTNIIIYPIQDQTITYACNNNIGLLKSSTVSNEIYSTSDYSISTKREININEFEIKKTLGRGSFGKVVLVKNKLDNNLYAMKILHKAKIRNKNQVIHTKTEREILELVDNPFIVRLQFAFQTRDKLYLITDFMQGGELFYHLHKEKRFNETKTKIYTAEIVIAIEYLHKNNIIYRDLKPENILLDRQGHIKLTDFGLSKVIKNTDDNKAFTICGSPEYIAPEILIGNGYDKTVDWWSLGALVYEMLHGDSPFKFTKEKKLEIAHYKIPLEMPKSFSIEAKSFISETQLKDSWRPGRTKRRNPRSGPRCRPSGTAGP